MEREKSIGGILFRVENGKRIYLLLEYERINDEKGKHNYWDFVKGHVEKNEEEKETLIREIQEETGIKNIEILKGFKEDIKYFFKKDEILINKEVIYYLVRTSEKDIKISFEHSSYEWLEYKDAVKKIGFKKSKDILIKAENFLNNSLLKYQ